MCGITVDNDQVSSSSSSSRSTSSHSFITLHLQQSTRIRPAYHLIYWQLRLNSIYRVAQ